MPKFIKSVFRFRITRHILFWVANLIVNTVMYGQFQGDYLLQFIMHLYYLPVVMMATYFTIYFLIPRYLQTQKYFLFSILLILSALVFSALQRLNIIYIMVPIHFPQAAEQYKFISFQLIFRVLKIYPPVFLAASIKLFMEWYRDREVVQQMEKDKLEAELKFLKAQIHPHFLFNTLNNLYALTLKKSDKAPGTVLKISELLNYMLYECNAPTVSLSKEINLIKDYIELEKLRYGKKLDIEFNVNDENTDIPVAPLLLLPFVENSFKHGVSKKVSEKWIKIDLSISNDLLLFTISNSKNKFPMDTNQTYTEGIGLNNIKRRLDILYENKYTLDIDESENQFKVTLQLQLK